MKTVPPINAKPVITIRKGQKVYNHGLGFGSEPTGKTAANLYAIDFQRIQIGQINSPCFVFHIALPNFHHKLARRGDTWIKIGIQFINRQART